MLSIARVIARLEPGGAQLGALRLTLALRARGFDSRILAGEATIHGARLWRSAGVEVDVWGRESGLQYARSRPFAEWLRARIAGADIVHGHMFGAWWAASRVTPESIPLVASEHNAIRWPGEGHEDAMRHALGRVDAFFAHGPLTRADALRLGLEPERLFEGRSAIEHPASSALPGLPIPRLMYAGRLHPEKGPDVLLDALALLPHPPAAFLLGSGPQAKELRARVAELGLDELVRFPGWRTPVGPWLRGATACVVPSRWDAWSQTAVTAMANGVPVIASAVEGLPRTLGERRGVLVPVDDPRALADALVRALEGRLDVDLRAARRYAEGHAARAIASHYAAVYARLVGGDGLSASEEAEAA